LILFVRGAIAVTSDIARIGVAGT